MDISIFGTGYVGLVTGACLSEVGHNVSCIDIDHQKIDQLNKGNITIYEPGLEEIVSNNIKLGRLKFFNSPEETIKNSDVIMIAVGTPSDEDGSTDFKYVSEVAKTIGQLIDDFKIIVTKSTVPVGTSDKLRTIIQKELDNRGIDINFSIASNPEFLKEGDAVSDFMKPDRIILGCEDEVTEKTLRHIYSPFCRDRDRCILMDIKSSEFTKYASNAMLATKISFMNELSRITEKVDVDIEKVRVGIGSDTRIGHSFIYPGIGYGGSCFPKDIKSLLSTAKEAGYNSKILKAVEDVNNAQKRVIVDKILNHFNNEIENLKFGLWGLSFKPKTDDMREAPSKIIIDLLLNEGAKVVAFDPEAIDNARLLYSENPNIEFCNSKEDAIKNSDALIVATEWKVFTSPDFKELKKLLRQPVIFDGRNIFNQEELISLGFSYYGIGR